MDLGFLDDWWWVWLGAAIAASVGELLIAGSFAFMPFAVGAATAAIVALSGLGLVAQWVTFVAVSAASFAALRPLSRRLDARAPQHHIGANRWVGREAVVRAAIGPGSGALGTVRLDGDEWRAESLMGTPIAAGSTVLVSRVEGTRLVVVCLDGPPGLGPATDPQGGSE